MRGASFRGTFLFDNIKDNYLTMSTNNVERYDDEMDATPAPWVYPRDIRDLFSYRLALLTKVNDRQAHAMLMSDYKLTLGEWRTMAAVRYLDKPSVRAVARATQQDEAQVSRYVAGLIKRDLLTKTTSTEDRRSILLALTTPAEKLYAEVMDFAWRLNRDMFVDLSKREQQTLVKLLDKLFQSINR
ncbi:MAG: winged helix-turn-helix transcriptional regulator [Aquamicrobium sp.]|uniref:MarR family winged helix-turn-helix transcriptional regulator n=1 Tax=Mesorhizobium sp. Pch-S TaxID=2082387 RepID=UPI0010105125|nr:MarR family winged helix-turn-helix transcriptional regulator [Mesorhizobium sp. Pch-S]MBR2687414.1 winged helix-turn-helix transcriptional regulator [Aquamicrobium sp.]